MTRQGTDRQRQLDTQIGELKAEMQYLEGRLV